MNAQDAKINADLAHAYEYLTKAIHSLLTDLKYYYRLMSIIK